MQTVYIAVNHITRERPRISLTIGELAEKIGVHRNSIKLTRGAGTVKGWEIYTECIEMTKKALGRKYNLPQYRNND